VPAGLAVRYRVALMFGSIASKFCALPNFRGKQRVFKAVFRWMPFGSAKSHYGIRMSKNILDTTWRASMVGAYEDVLQEFVVAIDEPFVFLDIGSNQGLYGIMAAEHPHCVRSICIEPNPATFSYLTRNASLSESNGQIVLICAAVATGASHFAELAVSTSHSGASSLTSLTKATSSDTAEMVLLLDASALLELLEPFQDIPVYAKIDVEGAELIVLESLDRSGLITRSRAIVVEVSEKVGGPDQSRQILSFFESRDWDLAARSGSASHFDAVFENRSLAI